MQFTAGAFIYLLLLCHPQATHQELSPEEAEKIARDAWIYAFPMFGTYMTIVEQIISPGHDYNIIQISNETMKPGSIDVVSPNADTPYSFLWMDLRDEPMVLGIPRMESKRYYSVQLLDLYTHVFDYIGTRTTGQNAGKYMIAGPKWDGCTPEEVDKVIRSDTDIVFALYRTQLFNDTDMPNVIAIQKKYTVTPLSKFLNETPPQRSPRIKFPDITSEQLITTKAFTLLNSLLKYCQPPHYSEKNLMEEFAEIGIKPSDSYKPPGGMRKHILKGIVDASKWVSTGAEDPEALGYKVKQMFGTREFMKNNYEIRAIAAAVGLFGNYYEEAMYPMLVKDSNGDMLDAKTNKYTLTFKGGLPPVQAFWSVTMYDKATFGLVENSMNRYLVNPQILPSLILNSNGGLTVFLQHEKPTSKKGQANWLPAPAAPFYVILRFYIPLGPIKCEKWTVPQIRKVN